MRKFKLIISAGLLLAAFACNENKERPVEPQVEARTGAQSDAAPGRSEEWDMYRVDAESRIDSNERKIEELEARKSNARANAKKGYDKQIGEFREKNKKLRERLREFKNDGNQKWEEFKREFDHDMGELRKSLNDFTENNKK